MIYKKEDIDMSLVQCPYEEERGYICIEDEYTNNILKLSGYSDIGEHDFYVLCNGRIFEKATYEYALKSASNAYNYAHDRIGSVFPLGEEIIAADTYYSFIYAKYVIQGRFELGENAIATSALFSYRYAVEVIKERFELGEQAISTDASYSFAYTRNVLKGTTVEL